MSQVTSAQSEPVLFYVAPTWRRAGPHTPLLNPFWGNPVGASSLYTKQLFDSYHFDTSLYGVTEDAAMARAVLVPYRHQWLLLHDPALLRECAECARAHGLPVVIDGSGDIEDPVSIEGAFILRTGGYRFLPEAGSITVPFLADDLLERCRGGLFEVRKKTAGKPVVGFAGWTRLTRRQQIKTLLKELPIRARSLVEPRYRACAKGVLWRQRALAALRRSATVDLLVHERETFSASAKTAKGSLVDLREDMVDTVLGSDYALDVRGDANNSTRLFEILSLGRIPVIVDTERNLPFSDEVDYRSFALVVDCRDIDTLGERIAAFHESVTPEQFEHMQLLAREAFVRYFRIDALAQHILKRITLV